MDDQRFSVLATLCGVVQSGKMPIIATLDLDLGNLYAKVKF